tara:strand:- start:109 stop:444 length:336 start_codon:yes stop_codon:yes gene_type:complete
MKTSGKMGVTKKQAYEKAHINLHALKLNHFGAVTFKKKPKSARGVRSYTGMNVLGKKVGAGAQLNGNAQGVFLTLPGMTTKFIGFGKPKSVSNIKPKSKPKSKSKSKSKSK